MSDERDLRDRFDALRTAVAPLEDAPASIERAVVRRRRRPLAVGGGLAGAAAVTAVALALLPGLGMFPGGAGTASMTTEATSESATDTLEADAPSYGFVPVEMSGETVGEWAAGADVLVVVGADDEALATVSDVPWRRTTTPDSPAGSFDLAALPIGADGQILLSTALGTSPEPTLAPGSDYLVALRWELVRCDGAAPGWILLGDDAVLRYADGGVLSDSAPSSTADAPLPDLDAPAAAAFVGLTADDVGGILSSVIDTHGIERARGLCQ